MGVLTDFNDKFIRFEQYFESNLMNGVFFSFEEVTKDYTITKIDAYCCKYIDSKIIDGIVFTTIEVDLSVENNKFYLIEVKENPKEDSKFLLANELCNYILGDLQV